MRKPNLDAAVQDVSSASEPDDLITVTLTRTLWLALSKAVDAGLKPAAPEQERGNG